MNEVTRTWTINGKRVKLSFPPLRRLLDILREDLSLKGTKEGCGEGECGACTVLIDGEALCSCLITGGHLKDGVEILTIEGLEETRRGRLLQEAYIEAGAVQCGFCIPGMLMSSYALLSHQSSPSQEEIKEAHAGNICRCTGYIKIFEAVELASRKWEEDRKGEQ
mgnify:CR=1 FL=1